MEHPSARDHGKIEVREPIAGGEPARKRRTQAERSKTMRARLAAAAYEAIAEGGLKGLRMKAVAAAAGVSQGALLHHFPDKRAITVAAIREALELARAEGEAHLAGAPTAPEALLRAMLEEFRAFFFSDRFWVAIGITIEASKDAELYPGLRDEVASLRVPIYAAWARRLAERGWTAARAEVVVRSGAALIAGLATRRLWTEFDATSAAVIDDWIAAHLA